MKAHRKHQNDRNMRMDNTPSLFIPVKTSFIVIEWTYVQLPWCLKKPKQNMLKDMRKYITYTYIHTFSNGTDE